VRLTIVQLRYAALAMLLAACTSQATPQPRDEQTKTGTSAITVTLRLPHEEGTGEVVSVRVHLASPSGQAYLHTVNWGDGTQTYDGNVAFSCPAMGVGTPSPAPAPGPSTSDSVIQHIYRSAGSHPITVTAVHGGCYPPIPQGTGSDRRTIRITGTTQPGNGPTTPTGAMGLKTVHQGLLTAYLEGRDLDGYVRTVTVDWGDGTQPETRSNPASCADPHSSWRASSLTQDITHQFRPGSYTLRLATTSTDCGGTAAQTDHVSRRVRIETARWVDLDPPRQLPPYPAPYTESCCY
jgi:hypothetical protein